jgi:aspartate-semialdehyde dehydrogenase
MQCPTLGEAGPPVDEFRESGFVQEEMKIVRETRKILETPNIMVNPTVARVPVRFSHSEALHIETRTKITVDGVQKLLNSAAGVVLMDGRETGACLTAAADIRKGAALNSIQTAEILVNQLM